MYMSSLREKAFNLSDHDVQWVEATLTGMDLETKVGQRRTSPMAAARSLLSSFFKGLGD